MYMVRTFMTGSCSTPVKPYLCKMKQKTCNKELVEEVAKVTKESTAQVKEAVSFLTAFVATTIKVGAYETVMVPYFGKFQPKTKEIQWTAHRRGMTKTTTHAEPIHSNGGLPGGDQQGVDPTDSGILGHPEG